MTPERLSTEQLQLQLIRQVGFLTRSARDFDAGHDDEAVRLATTVRVLLHDTALSHSLLGQLGLRDIDWVDTGTYREERDREMQSLIDELLPGENLVIVGRSPFEVGLVRVDASGDWPRFAAPLGSGGERLSSLTRWWDEPVIETSSGGTYSRKQLVLAMANRDGGAHVHPTVDARYADFVVDNMGILTTTDQGDFSLSHPPSGYRRFDGNVAAESMRQVAWEVLETLRRQPLPWLAGSF